MSTLFKYIMAALLACSTLTAYGQVAANDVLPKGFYQLEEYPFVIVSRDYVDGVPQLSDSLFYEIADAIRFKVGSTSILTRDAHFADTYTNGLLPLIKERGMRLRKVFVRGASSPDGSYGYNKILSDGRTKTIMDMIGRLGVASAGNVEASNVTEDYRFLVRLMESAGDPLCEEIRAVVESRYESASSSEEAEKACKAALMSMSGGKTWKYLYEKYFPEMRSAKVVFWLDIPVPEDIAIHQDEVEIFPEIVPEPPVVVQLEPVTGITIPEVSEIPLPDMVPDVPAGRQHMLALRTNLLYDLFVMPHFGFAPMWDIQLEYYPRRGHMTYNAEFTSPYWKKWDQHKFFQIRDYRIEARRYFRGEADFTGWFASAFVMNNIFGIGISDEKGWMGEGLGGGLQGGYVLPISRKGDFRLEFYAGAGVYTCRHDPYTYGNPVTGNVNGYYYYKFFGSADKFRERNHRFTWFGPVSAGVALTYDIVYRKDREGRR